MRFLILHALLLSGSILANCPAPDKIHLYCDRHHHCNWGANFPGWEGFFIGPHLEDTFIQSFEFVVWWNDHGNPENGTMLCLYKGNLGSTVRMSQGSWGGIAEPKDKVLWRTVTYEGHAMLACREGLSACQFNY